jgi:hypothetical protein
MSTRWVFVEIFSLDSQHHIAQKFEMKAKFYLMGGDVAPALLVLMALIICMMFIVLGVEDGGFDICGLRGVEDCKKIKYSMTCSHIFIEFLQYSKCQVIFQQRSFESYLCLYVFEYISKF